MNEIIDISVICFDLIDNLLNGISGETLVSLACGDTFWDQVFCVKCSIQGIDLHINKSK